MRPKFNICVFCGSKSGNNPIYQTIAGHLVKQMAKREIGVELMLEDLQKDFLTVDANTLAISSQKSTDEYSLLVEELKLQQDISNVNIEKNLYNSMQLNEIQTVTER